MNMFWGQISTLYFLAHAKKQIYILQGEMQIRLFVSGSVHQVVVFLSTYAGEVKPVRFCFFDVEDLGLCLKYTHALHEWGVRSQQAEQANFFGGCSWPTMPIGFVP